MRLFSIPILLASLLMLALLLPVASAAGQVLIYKSDACSHCKPYTALLLPLLQKNGYSDVKIIDFINDPPKRAELARLQAKFGVPIELQGHMVTLINDRYLLEGHIPLKVVDALLSQSPPPPSGLVLFQDSMVLDASEYTLYAGGEQALECSATQSPAECEKSSQGKTDVSAYLSNPDPSPSSPPGGSSLPPIASPASDAAGLTRSGFPPTANALTLSDPSASPASALALPLAALMLLSPLALLGYYYYENRSG